MRLLPEQIEHIVTASRELLGADARVWLFGSRVHDDFRGGDIDLLVEAGRPVGQPVTPAAASGLLKR
jgi:predicted nucleotidyltransferase